MDTSCTTVRFTLNGSMFSYEGSPLKRVLDVLREDCGLTAAKEGCGEGECGACAILLDGTLANSCLLPVSLLEGKACGHTRRIQGHRRFPRASGCL